MVDILCGVRGVQGSRVHGHSHRRLGAGSGCVGHGHNRIPNPMVVRVAVGQLCVAVLEGVHMLQGFSET